MQIVQSVLWWIGAVGVGLAAYFLVGVFWPWSRRDKKIVKVLAALVGTEVARWSHAQHVGPPDWVYAATFCALWAVVLIILFFWYRETRPARPCPR